ncbi:hypothetical protein RhoFasGS6_05038 [Rhodococcus fascians]|nr:hypothetical protein [Rhodococcus fascians]
MRDRKCRSLIRATELVDRDRLARGSGGLSERREVLRIAQRLHEEGEGGDAGIGNHRLAQGSERQVCFTAGGDESSESDSAAACSADEGSDDTAGL